jgi:hypothetical protein
VKDCAVISETEVREQFRRLKPLKEISVAQRGWTLDVLNIVRRLPLKVGDEVTSLKLKTGKGFRAGLKNQNEAMFMRVGGA